MIKLLMAGAVMMSLWPAAAQIRKIPAVVTDALKEKYPSAEAVEWKDKLGYFKASFELDHARLAAQFSAKGEWLQTECVIDEGDLPEAVLDGWQKSRYAHRVLVEAAKILLPEGGVQYRLLVKKNDFEKKLLFFDSSERLQKEQPSL
jgi:hypothetical protein